MFKKFILIILILIPVFTYAQSAKNSMAGKIGLSLYGGPLFPVSGEYSGNTKNTDLLNTGSQFSIGLSYFITKGFGIEGTMTGGYNYFNSKYRSAGKEPVYIGLESSVNLIYNFGHFFRKPVFSPVVKIGAGSYNWEQLNDGILNAEVNEQLVNHKVHALGLNFSAGAEYNLSKKFSAGLMLNYNLLFPKMENSETGTEHDKRTTHGYFTPQIKLSYYFPTR